MIVPMEKITALIFHKTKDQFLLSLQKLGVIHVALQKGEVVEESVAQMQDKIERTKMFLRAAKKHHQKIRKEADVIIHTTAADDPFAFVKMHENTQKEISQLEERLSRIDSQMRSLSIWGKFDMSLVKKLRQDGINTRFFTCALKQFKKLNLENVHHQEIARASGQVYLVAFETNQKAGLDCDEFLYPDTDLKQLEESFLDLQKQKREKQEKLNSLYRYEKKLQRHVEILQTSCAYKSISSNLATAAEESVYIIKGWLPREDKKRVEEFLINQDIYFYFSRPEVDEPVPVLLRNNRFAKLFEPITKLFDLPKYAELDLTAFFAPFFTLFFGFCLGDAGYGLILLISALIFRIKLPQNKKPIASLVAILGASTFFFGLISGTLFGADLSKVQGLKQIVLFNQDQLFNAALVLGIIQVLFGMSLKAASRIRQYGFMAGVSTFGWMILLLGIIGLMFSKDSIWLVYSGVALILLFNDLKANVFLRIGKGLWELYGITGVFGDVLSYIRLFALGISSSILGFVVNEIALQCRGIPYVGFVVTLLILVLGHAGNLALSALSSFVHPLRLTFVEFYKSAGFQGGGKAYDPFRKISS